MCQCEYVHMCIHMFCIRMIACIFLCIVVCAHAHPRSRSATSVGTRRFLRWSRHSSRHWSRSSFTAVSARRRREGRTTCFRNCGARRFGNAGGAAPGVVDMGREDTRQRNVSCGSRPKLRSEVGAPVSEFDETIFCFWCGVLRLRYFGVPSRSAREAGHTGSIFPALASFYAARARHLAPWAGSGSSAPAFLRRSAPVTPGIVQVRSSLGSE